MTRKQQLIKEIANRISKTYSKNNILNEGFMSELKKDLKLYVVSAAIALGLGGVMAKGIDMAADHSAQKIIDRERKIERYHDKIAEKALEDAIAAGFEDRGYNRETLLKAIDSVIVDTTLNPKWDVAFQAPGDRVKRVVALRTQVNSLASEADSRIDTLMDDYRKALKADTTEHFMIINQLLYKYQQGAGNYTKAQLDKDLKAEEKRFAAGMAKIEDKFNKKLEAIYNARDMRIFILNSFDRRMEKEWPEFKDVSQTIRPMIKKDFPWEAGDWNRKK